MRLSTRARYALRMMLDVARNGGEEGPVSLGSVAARTDISRGYLEQVALALRSARLLRGVSGRKGGYRLASPAAEITIGQVLQALLGPVCLVDCIDDPVACPRSDYCECRVFYTLINDKITQVLETHTLADLLDPAWAEAHGAEGYLGVGRGERSEAFGCNPNRRQQIEKGTAR